MGVPVETVVPRLAVPSAPAGTLGPLQPSSQGMEALEFHDARGLYSCCFWSLARWKPQKNANNHS